MLDVWLLGRGGMMPLTGRPLTSALFRYNGDALLIDCGEGTQMAMRDMDCPFKRIGAVLLTHFHADHVSGLPGLLLTIGNAGREEPLLIAGPEGVDAVVNALRVIAPTLPFPIRYLPLSLQEERFPVMGFHATAFRVRHGTACYGYALEVPRAGRFDPARAKAANVPLPAWALLQKQPSVTMDGAVYTQEMVMGPPRKGVKVVYCTDTLPVSAIEKHARDADLAILEGMYGGEDGGARARKYMHMSMCDAARIARDAGVKRLWLTHYSPAERTPEESAANARLIFPTLNAAERGLYESLTFPEDGA